MQLTAKQEKITSVCEGIDVNQKISLKKAIPLSLQHLFAMFGASVLVPILFNIDPATVLFFNGIGTLLYAFVTNRKIPAYLGSSFAFISPVLLLLKNGYGFEYAQGGFVISGLIFVIIALLVKKIGIEWIYKLLPPASMGAIVTIIGLELAPTAVNMAGLTANTIDPKAIIVSLVTLTTVILSSVLLKGFLKVIPILIGVIVGYITACLSGLVNIQPIIDAKFFVLPHLKVAKFEFNAIMVILPATFVIIAEHIGHIAVTSNIVGKDLAKNPGLHKSLLGDGLSTIFSGMFGSVPTTTYGENIGVMAITKVYSTYVICGAGALSIILGFSGKLAAIIKSIPNPVIGGISILLFGTIATSGLRTFIEEKVDFSKSKNLILTSIILIIGLSGLKISFPGLAFELKGMSLATVVGILLNIIFILLDKLGIMNEK